jgi:SAM-dependent methyltransferase
MTTSDAAFEQWQSAAQSGELEYHVERKTEPDHELEKLNHELFEGFGFQAEEWSGKTVVDIGAGSHLRTSFFAGARIVAVEPLANEYLEKIKWCELGAADVVHAITGEQRIDELEGTADLVVCINVLDHTYDPAAIVENVHGYLHEDGQFLLSMDLHGQTADGMHPVEFTAESLIELLFEQGFAIDRGYRYLAHRRSYGHGDTVTLVLHRRRAGEPTGSDVAWHSLRTPRQLLAEEMQRRASSICRRIKRILTGESRGVRRLFGKAA